MLYGEFLIAVLLGTFSFFSYKGWGQASVICMLVHTIVFQLSFGAAHWVYIPEILTDAQFGLVTTIHYMNGVEISLVSESMFSSWGPSGTFLFYSIISSVGLIFMKLFVKETTGLTDR
jgi:hypothetical protein